MSNDELREAAERLASGKDLRSTCPHLGSMAAQVAIADGIALADAYLAEHKPRPIEAYLEFAHRLVIEDCGLPYHVAVAIAKAMHKRKMVI